MTLMRYNLPPLKPLKVFEVTARHKSFTRAAEELCITQSAVSHQIKQLEAYLCKTLFVRDKNKTVLTQDGDMLLSVVTDSFSRLSAVCNHLLSADKMSLKIMAQTSIAADWLSPRLADFALLHPEVDLSLGMESYASGFNANDYDVIVATWPAPEEFVTQKLRHEHWFPVAKQEILDSIDYSSAANLLQLPLYSSEKKEDWNLWMQQNQIRKPVDIHIHQFELAVLAVKAALGGKGVALGCGFMTDDLVDQGLLTALPEFSYELPWGHYHVHYRSNSFAGEAIEAFVGWVIEEANKC